MIFCAVIARTTAGIMERKLAVEGQQQALHVGH